MSAFTKQNAMVATLLWAVGVGAIAWGGMQPNLHSMVPAGDQGYPWFRVALFSGIALLEIAVFLSLMNMGKRFPSVVGTLLALLAAAIAICCSLWFVMHAPMWYVNHLRWLLCMGALLVGLFAYALLRDLWDIFSPSTIKP